MERKSALKNKSEICSFDLKTERERDAAYEIEEERESS